MLAGESRRAHRDVELPVREARLLRVREGEVLDAAALEAEQRLAQVPPRRRHHARRQRRRQVQALLPRHVHERGHELLWRWRRDAHAHTSASHGLEHFADRRAKHDEAAHARVLLHGAPQRVLRLLGEAVHLMQNEHFDLLFALHAAVARHLLDDLLDDVPAGDADMM